MARPIKETVDYFTHDADASESRTVSILENHFGAEGYATWFKLLERISRTRKHIIICRNGEDTEFLAAKLKLQPERLLLILNKMAELNAIDPELWAKNKIIWCQNLVDRLKPVYDNRKQVIPHKPDITTTNNTISTVETALTIPETPQSKGSKVKGVKEIRESTPPHSKYGEFENVLLGDEEYQKLIDRLGKAQVDDLIEQLSRYMRQSPANAKKYKEHYATILSWSRRDERSQVGKTGRPDEKTGTHPLRDSITRPFS